MPWPILLLVALSMALPLLGDDSPLTALGDAYFKRDVAAMERIRASEEAAKRPYNAALADWLLSMSVGGDSTKVIEASRRADAALKEAIALDQSSPHPHVLRGRVVFMLFGQGAMPMPEAMKAMTEAHEAATKLAPDDPLTILQTSAMTYYSPKGDREQGRALMRQSIDGLTALAPNDPHAAIWLPLAWNWYGTMFLGEGDAEQARAAFEGALRVRPDYDFVRNSMIPMTNVVDGGAVPKFNGKGWTVLVTDAEADGRQATLPDLKQVLWRADRKTNRVWFRFDLANDADPDRFGINLAIDLDSDQKSGNGWWGGNTAFKYDRLVTVWVRRGSDGKYRGAVGTADADAITGGAMVTSAPGTVAFAVDGSKRSIYVGVDRKAFDNRASVPVVATVGSNVTWNDAAPASGSAILKLR